jgi:hypothetical protein
MELKLVCQCGQKYVFDVEPVGGRMPFAVYCPVCNADGTAVANALLAEKFRFVPPPPSAIAPPQFPASAPNAGALPPSSIAALRINRHDPAPVAAGVPPPVAPKTIIAPPESAASTRKLEWYEHIWCGLPLGLLAIGGAIGGVCGGAAWVVNRQVFLKLTNPILRYVVTGLISAAAFGAYLVLAVIFVALFHKN